MAGFYSAVDNCHLTEQANTLIAHSDFECLKRKFKVLICNTMTLETKCSYDPCEEVFRDSALPVAHPSELRVINFKFGRQMGFDKFSRWIAMSKYPSQVIQFCPKFRIGLFSISSHVYLAKLAKICVLKI